MNNELTAGAVPTPAAKQVTEQINLNSAALSSLEDTTRVLEEKLGVILREPEPRKDNVSEEVHLVPMANEIRSQHRRTASLNSYLMDLIDRIEL